MTLTPQQFHEQLQKRFQAHLEAVRKGEEVEYSFLAKEGVDYNSWLEHRHTWPVTEEGLCAPASYMAPCCEDHDDVYPLDADECETCTILLRLYKEALVEEHRRQTRYFLAPSTKDPLWQEVTQEEFVNAERAAGFRPKPGCGPVATAGFAAGSIKGRTYTVREHLKLLGRFVDLEGTLHDLREDPSDD